jgi:RIO kinase 1
MNKGSKFGRESAEEAWKSAEADAMATLHASGVKVPRPVLFYEGVLLMEVIGDAEGRVAPRLIDAGIAPEQASALYFQIRTEIIKMLSLDLIHGDLSEFNILLGVNGPIIIDFPQIVTAAKNSRSEHFFRRDLGNIVRFFSNLDPTLAKHVADADEIWRAYVRRDLSPHFVPTGRVPQPARNRGPARFNSGNQNSGRPPQSGPANSNASPHQGTPHRHPRGQTPPVEAGISGGAKRPNAAPSRRGPEVAVKGQGLRPRGAPQAGPEQRKSGGGANRRRPPRRF